MIITDTNISDFADLKSVAESVARAVGVGHVVCLTGDLGAGKTMFARFLISAVYGRDVEVNSPTFNILQIYDADVCGDLSFCAGINVSESKFADENFGEKNFPIYHYDFYRLENVDEVINLDLDYAARNALTIIEWPQVADEFISGIFAPEKIIRLEIYFKNDARFIRQIL